MSESTSSSPTPADHREDHADTRGGGRQMPGAPRWLVATASWTWRLLVLGVGIVAFWYVAGRLLVVTLPLTVAIILATLCLPAKRWLMDRGLSSLWATVVVVIGGIIAFVGMFAALAPAFIDQMQELGPTVVQGWDDLLQWVEDGPLGISQAQIQSLLDSVSGLVSSGGGEGGGVVSGVVSGVATVGQFIAGLALMIVLLFFLVKDEEEIVGWLRSRLPSRHVPNVTAVGQRAWSALSGYVRGTATIALIDAVGIGIGLAVLGVPLVLPLMLLVFFGGFLPVIGALLAGLVAVLVALADGGITTALLVLALILVVQQIEGNFLQPTIMRRAVALHPMVVLTALAAGGSLGGIIGAFLAVPIVAVLAAAGNEIRLRAEAGLLHGGADVPAEPIGGFNVDDEEEALAAGRRGRPRLRRDSGQDSGQDSGRDSGQDSNEGSGDRG